jgi:pimeloyl-ACP methyl ester carboxylesterase
MKLNQKLAIRYIRAKLNILSLVSPRQAAIKAFRLGCTPQQRVRKKGSAAFKKGERLSFRQDGFTIRGHRWLPETTPLKKVLIAHGFESASRNFEAYISLLLLKGYEVVAFDAPAHGQSGGRRLSLPDYVKTLLAIEHSYGPFQSYLGHSMGGLALALLLEETPHTSSTSLVLVAPAVETTTIVDNVTEILQLRPEVRKEVDDYFGQISGHPFTWYSLRRVLPRIGARILYLQDEGDRITPMKEAQLVEQDRHPNIRFVFTRGLGHRKIYKDLVIMNKIVDFL